MLAVAAKSLLEFGFEGRISFSGYGENLLNPDFPDIVREFRQKLPNNIIECNTNGDFVTVEMLQKLYTSGMSYIYINLYDKNLSADELINTFATAGIDDGLWMIRAIMLIITIIRFIFK